MEKWEGFLGMIDRFHHLRRRQEEEGLAMTERGVLDALKEMLLPLRVMRAGFRRRPLRIRVDLPCRLISGGEWTEGRLLAACVTECDVEAVHPLRRGAALELAFETSEGRAFHFTGLVRHLRHGGRRAVIALCDSLSGDLDLPERASSAPPAPPAL